MSVKATRFAQRIGQAILARHSLVGSVGWTLLAVVAPTILRLLLAADHNGTPFVTYYPAIVLATVFLGWRYGVLTTVLCAATANLLFLEAGPSLATAPETLEIFGLFVFSCAVLVTVAEALRRVVGEVGAAKAREALLNQELRHRIRNLLAVVNSLATLSYRHSDPEQAHNAFAERLGALDRATRLLGGDGAVSCELPELAEEALRPFLSDYDIRLSGPPQEIESDACVPAVLALHELATNAIKYGALSTSGGWVELRWSESADGVAALQWEEHGGPPVAEPKRVGMGSRILSMHSLAASFAITYPPDGVRCGMRLKAV